MSDMPPINRPVVAVISKRAPVGPAIIMLFLVGLGVFFWLSSARAAQQAGDGLPPLSAPAASQTAAVELKDTEPAKAAPTSGPAYFIPNSPASKSFEPAPAPAPYSVMPFAARPAPTGAADRMRERMRAPALIVDLAQADVPRAPGSPDTRSYSGSDVRTGTQPGATVVIPGVAAGNADRNLSDSERFSARVGGEEVEVARATRLANLDRLVPQGAVIGAVMETALNSDLPGYARAITQRDVYSFDGSAVLIPAGSRLIGQYKSGVAQGASRLFLVWTRLIRSDGVTIELGSPATDDLGRGGIGGKVNRHFLQRFGGAILTSVLSGGINAAAASLSGGSTIIVGSAGQASDLASQATQSNDIPPTITTKQGASVRIFVARDLDFSRVGPAR